MTAQSGLQISNFEALF